MDGFRLSNLQNTRELNARMGDKHDQLFKKLLKICV